MKEKEEYNRLKDIPIVGQESYEIGGMDVLSMIGRGSGKDYEKVVIMLHGGGGSGKGWNYYYNAGWFGDMTGIKLVFPTGNYTSDKEGYLWYKSFKIDGCDLDDDCAYDIPSIQDSATAIAALIEHEKNLLGGNSTKVFLAGFSMGG